MIISLTYISYETLKRVKFFSYLFMIVQSWKKKFHILAQFPFITSEKELHFYHQKVNIQVASRVLKGLKT